MLTYLSASIIYPVSKPPIVNGVIAVDETGFIRGVYTPEAAEELKLRPVQHYQCALVPGFVNTHCHLELSHLRAKIPQRTGLFRFVGQVMQHRFAAEAQIIEAMEQADTEMYQQGIVATADISNQAISASVKRKSKIYYHTFVEAMGFNPSQAETIMSKAQETAASFSPMKASIVPHAPYSVSDALFELINARATETENLLSMHNQETAAEDEFFMNKSGDFLDLYKMLGLNIDFYQASGKSSLQTTLPKLPGTKTLLVHNTQTKQADVDFAKAQHQDLYWCLCPNANLYIEDRLPDVAMLDTEGLPITLGTDSLASNHQLSILAEMQTLQQHKDIPFEKLLKWATINGAAFLGITATYGSLDVGKRPGILLLEHLEGERLSAATKIRRLY